MQMNSTQVFTMPAAPVVAHKGISTSAMLVEFGVSVWTGRKLDKKVSREVTDNKHAKRGVASVSKRLLGDCAELEAVEKCANAMRLKHAENTLPWSDSGLRLLTNAKFIEYQQWVTSAVQEFERLVDVFITAYDWEVAQAQMRLGDMFDRTEYPSGSSLRTKFGVRVNYMPLPEAGDWRVDTEKSTRDMLARQYESYYAAQVQAAMQHVWEKTRASLEKMSERLADADDGERKIFRDTLVSNVEDSLELMRTCNITDDPAMEQVRLKLRAVLTGVTPDALRGSSPLRRKTKAEIDEVIRNLPGFGF
jgi:hypothetical protein